jgi:hypothetical protein
MLSKPPKTHLIPSVPLFPLVIFTASVEITTRERRGVWDVAGRSQASRSVVSRAVSESSAASAASPEAARVT